MRLLIRLALTLLVILLILKVGWPLASLCMPFVLAVLFTWIMEPVVRWLDKKTFFSRKAVSILLILLICGALGGFLTWFVYRAGVELVSLSQNWDQVWNSIVTTFTQLTDWFSSVMEYLPESARTVVNEMSGRLLIWLKDFGTALIPKTTSFAMRIPPIVLALIFFLMASYFILSDYPNIRSTVTARMPENVRRFSLFVKKAFNAAFGGYIKAELLLSLGVFCILTVGFFIMDLPYAILVAFLFAVLDFIPIIGAGTVMVPWAVIDLVLGDWATAAYLMVVWGIIVLFRRIGEPKFVGSQTGLHPILSLLSIYVGMRVAGVLGMVFGPVLLLVIINICSSGFFDGVVADLSRASRDISAILRGGKEEESTRQGPPEAPPKG